jgi:hypothetical protein
MYSLSDFPSFFKDGPCGAAGKGVVTINKQRRTAL